MKNKEVNERLKKIEAKTINFLKNKEDCFVKKYLKQLQIKKLNDNKNP